MAQPSSLRSFNSRDYRDLNVVATQIKESSKDPLEPLIDPSFVHLNITVSPTFYPDDPWNDKIFEGPPLVGRRALTSSTIESPAECREEIRNILVDMGVPLELGDCSWRHKFLNAEEFSEMPRVEDLDRLIENVCWFLYEVKTQQRNKDFPILPVNLAIEKLIVVPDSEFEAGCSWYQRMVGNPDVGTQYAEAIGNPRTEDELLKELSFKFTAASERAIEALKHVKD